MKSFGLYSAFLLCLSSVTTQAARWSECATDLSLGGPAEQFSLMPSGNGVIATWKDASDRTQSSFCHRKAERFLCATPTEEPSVEELPTEVSVQSLEGRVIARFSSDDSQMTVALQQTSGGEIWSTTFRVDSRDVAIESLTPLQTGGWILIWRQLNAGTALWKAQELDAGGRRQFADAGIVLREAAVEHEIASLDVRKSRVTLGWIENSSGQSILHLWQWRAETLQAAPSEGMVVVESQGAQVLAIHPAADDHWVAFWTDATGPWPVFAAAFRVKIRG